MIKRLREQTSGKNVSAEWYIGENVRNHITSAPLATGTGLIKDGEVGEVDTATEVRAIAAKSMPDK
jgi:hypothetical protein